MADFRGGQVSIPAAEEEIPEKRRKIGDSNAEIELTAETSNNVEPWLNFPQTHSRSNHVDDKVTQNDNASIAVDEVDDPNDMNHTDTASEQDWNRDLASTRWLYSHISSGANPRDILERIYPGIHFDASTNPALYWDLVVSALQSSTRRQKLNDVNSLEQVVDLIKTSKKIVVLTGAGVSVSCGIPDFRSRDGIYARLAVDFPELSDPQAMFDINFFRENPHPFFKFAKEIYPGQYQPSRSHRFIAQLEKTDRLLRNYSQNIDTLETVAGIERVIHCHGSFKTATCTTCKYNAPCDSIKEEINRQEIPRCPKCFHKNDDEEDDGSHPMKSVMKPDIVFFGENLPDAFHRQMAEDKNDVDLLIVIGSSLKVKPVANIPDSIPSKVPQILINRERLKNFNFDVELLGDCDTIVSELSRRLGLADFRSIIDTTVGPLSQVTDLPETEEEKPETSEEEVNNTTEETPMIATDEETTGDDTVSPDKNGHSTTTTKTLEEDPSEEDDQQVVATCAEKPISPQHEITAAVEEADDDEAETSTESCKETPESCTTTAKNNRWALSVSQRLPDGCFFYNGSSRYIFTGAEVYFDELFNLSDSDSERKSSRFGDSDDDEEDDDDDDNDDICPVSCRPPSWSPVTPTTDIPSTSGIVGTTHHDDVTVETQCSSSGSCDDVIVTEGAAEALFSCTATTTVDGCSDAATASPSSPDRVVTTPSSTQQQLSPNNSTTSEQISSSQHL